MLPPIVLLILLFVLVVFPFRAASASPGEDSPTPTGPLSVSVDRESVPLGSVATLTLTYRLPEGGRLKGPPEVLGLEGLTVMDLRSEPDRLRVRLLMDRLGTVKTGPVSLVYLDGDGQRGVLSADPVSFTVLSNLGEKPEEATLKPLRDIVSTRARWLKALPWVGGLIGLMLAAGGFWWWRRKRQGKGPYQDMEDPPHVRAQWEIEGLEARGLFEKGQVREFYYALSEILRRYLETLRDFPAAEFTTEEISRSVRNEEDRILLPLLRQADLVKFADTVPTHARKEEDVRTALAYIHQTGPFEGKDRVQARDGEVAR